MIMIPQHFRSSSTYFAPAFIAAFALIAVAAVVTMTISMATGAVSAAERPVALILLFVVIFAMAGGSISHHRLEIEDDKVRLIWFPAYRKTILKSNIVTIAPMQVSAWRNGLGLRLLGNSTLALMNRGGDGILITTRNGWRYLIVIKNQHEHSEVLRVLQPLTNRSRLRN